MRAEMPKKFWPNLPESRLIAPLMRDAAKRSEAMVMAAPTPARRPSSPPSPVEPPPAAERTPEGLRQGLAACTRCGLCRAATQVVPGEGPLPAPLMLVGEQPGDQEDLQGHPFVGPAGNVLDRALAARRHRPRRRLPHQRGQALQVRAARQAPHPPAPRCRRDRALPLVARPRARARPAEARSWRWAPPPCAACAAQRPDRRPARPAAAARPATRRLLVTVHPSYLLRLPDRDRQRDEYRRFVADLALARETMGSLAAARATGAGTSRASSLDCTS